MGSVTPTVVPGDGYVRVEVNWQDFTHARRAWIWRTLGGVDTRLRDGDYVWLSNGIAVAFDHEAPLDTGVSYKSAIPLNWNGDFQSGVSEWLDTTNQGTVGAVAQSTAYWASGNASLQLTPDGSATCRAVSEFLPATVGTSYTASAQLMVPSYWAGGIGIQIQWYNGTTFLSSSAATPNTTPFAGAWNPLTVTATAPATTTQMRIAATIAGTPPKTLPLYVDEFYASTAAATVTSGVVTVPSAGAGWWTDPLHPATKVRLQIDLNTGSGTCLNPPGIVYLGVGPDKTQAATGATFDINAARYPAAAWSLRKAPRSTIRLGTLTGADSAALDALHASGAPLLLAMSADYGEPLQYQLCGDLVTSRIHGEQKVPWRFVSADFAESPAPVGPAEGTLKTRYQDIRYPTFTAALAAGATWLDVLRGNAA